MQRASYTSVLPHHQQRRSSTVSLGMLVLWTICACGAFVGYTFGIWQEWSDMLFVGTAFVVLMLCFSLQWDIARHYVPEVLSDKWFARSGAGLVLGIFAAYVLGMGGVLLASRISSAVESYEISGFLILTSVGFAFSVGFAMLGWQQALVLRPYVKRAWWWVGVLGLAWVPVVVAWLGYEAIVRLMVVNIFPEAHSVVQLLTAEAALLCPSLIVFALIVRRRSAAAIAGTIQVSRPSQLPRSILAGLFVLPLTAVTAFGTLIVGQSLRVERAWISGSPAGYLSISEDGRVKTSPPPNEKWDPHRKLWDLSPDGSMRAGVEGPRVVISNTSGSGSPILGGTIIRSIEVFSGPPPEDHYAPDVVNVVRFSPDGALLAAGTGDAIEGDSFVNSSNDHAVHVWSVPDGVLRYTLTDPQYSVRDIAWSPNGRYLAAAGGLVNRYGMFDGDNVVRVWRVDIDRGVSSTSPPLELSLVGHTTAVEALAWSPSSNRLVSHDASGRVVIWRIP